RPIDQGAIAVTAPDHDPGVVAVTVEAGISSVPVGNFTYDAPTAPLCTYGLSASDTSPPSTGGAINLSVSTASTCEWSAASQGEWLTVGATAVTTGGGTVQVTADLNANPTPRSGDVVVVGQSVTLSQNGGGCGAPVVAMAAAIRNVGSTAGRVEEGTS